MRKQSTSSLHFQRKISEFCNIRVAPFASNRALENIRPYLTSLIIYRKAPPMRNGRIDWQAVAGACGIEDEMTAELKKNLRSGLEAIIRWLDTERPAEDHRPAVEQSRTNRNPAGGSAKAMAAQPRSSAAIATVGQEQTRAKPGVQPRPIEEFPKPLFDWTEEPDGFQQALIYHMRRHGDSYWHLHRAVVREEDAFDRKTLLSWTKGTKVPRSIESLDILSRIERRYRLPAGYFKAKLPHQARSGVRSRGRKRYRCCGAAPACLASAGQLQRPAVRQARGNPGMGPPCDHFRIHRLPPFPGIGDEAALRYPLPGDFLRRVSFTAWVSG